MKMTGSEAIVTTLIEEGVNLIFGYPGGAIMPTYDALFHKTHSIHHVLVRHEQGAVHAATGYAKASDKVGVCLATSGPGATNLITGIADAMLDSVPLVCITGQVSEHLLGTDAFQESDIIGMTVPITKWNYQITSPHEIPSMIHKAFKVALSGRPGPVLLDITKDAQSGTFHYSKQSELKCERKQSAAIDPLLLKKASDLLNSAARPLILAGHGVSISGAEQELIKIAEKADLPVACTLLGLSCFPSEHPLFKGLLGMHGNYAANVLSNEADVVLAVGMRFDDRVTGDLSRYLVNTKVIHIEIDQSELNKNVHADVGILADAKWALNSLLPYIHSNRHSSWQKKFALAAEKEYKEVIKKQINPSSERIKMAEFIHILSEKTKGSALLVTDVGQHQMEAARYYRFNQCKSHITSGGLGTMGFSLPAAIGVQFAQKNRLVISVSGDGGFQMNLQELAVLVQEKLPVKIIILNNGFLGMVRQWQELFYERRYSFTEMHNPDFVQLAHAYGIPGSRLEFRECIPKQIGEMLSYNGPYLLEVLVEKEDNVFPMVPSGASVSEVRLS